MRGLISAFVLVALGLPVAADTPRSAIPWLSDVLSEPVAPPEGSFGPFAPGTVPRTIAPFAPTDIETSALDDPVRDGNGLLTPTQTGLPSDLWKGTSALRVRRLLETRRPSGVPAARDLFRTLLLARTEPPIGANPENRVLLARIDVLMDSGMLTEAEALLTSGALTDPALFRRAFDLGLLRGRADDLCARLRESPGLSPTLPARVYCLARLGDWPAASLTLNLGRDVGTITAAEEALLARFLDPQVYEGAPDVPLPTPLTTLDFILREAIALPRPTSALPLAFLAVDVAVGSPLKARLEALERLLREGAIPATQLFEAYRDGTPAASGGVWDRMAMVRDLDQAFATANTGAVMVQLPQADALFADLGLRKPFAQTYARQLAALPRETAPTDARRIVAELLLLAGEMQSAATWLPENNDAVGNFYRALAENRLRLPDTTNQSPVQGAVRQGLTAHSAPSEAATQIEARITAGQLGEALILILDLLSGGAEVDPGDLTDALYLLRTAGQEPAARQIAIETLLLLPRA